MNTYHADAGLWRSHLEKGLEEDGWRFDWTTLSSIPPQAQMGRVKARVIARREGVWACKGLVDEVFALSSMWGMPIETKCSLEDGERIAAGKEVCEWQGPARTVLAMERPFLNLAGFVCGIASRTRRLVEAVREAAPPELKSLPRVTATRKTLPGYRDLSLHGVICGDGSVHRANLFSGILIKENHISAAGGVSIAVQAAKARAPHGLRIEVEVRNERELEEALASGAEVIMLDNFSPEQARKAAEFAKIKRSDVLIEVSGNLSELNIGSYVFPGVDILSSGAITHSAGTLDLSLLVEDL